MDFYKITSTLTRPNKDIPWFSVGNQITRYFDTDYVFYIKLKWVWPGYLTLGTDIPGVKDALQVTEIDDHNCTWIRYWYNKTYYDQYLEDELIQKVTVQENDYRIKNSLVYKEHIEYYPGKVTKNGFYYVGNHYKYSIHLNQ